MSSAPPPMQVLPVTAAYAVSATTARPGGLTAVGVISLILGILGILINIGTAAFSGMTLVTATVQQRSASRFDASRYPLLPPASATSPDGLNDYKADAVVQGLNSTRPLTPSRQQHVKLLALKYGRKLFTFTADSFTASRVRSNITDSGPMLMGGGQAGDFYLTSTGRIEVSNNAAIFRSDDGEVFRSGDVTHDDSLSEPEIARVVAAVKGHSVQLNAAQEATIQRLLRDPLQQIAVKTDPGFDSLPVLMAGDLEQNGIWFLTGSAQVRLDAAGTETLLSNQAPIPGMNPFTGKQIRTVWAQMLLLECLASGLVAILLLIAGVMVLRGRPAGRKLHLLFAALKLPLAIVGALLLGFTVSEWLAAIRSQTGVQAAALTSSILVGVAGLVWPIIALVTMTRRSVKDYFKGVI